MFRNHSKKVWLLLPASAMVIALSACGRGSQNAADDALKNDLSLASQAQAYQPHQFMSPTEQGYGASPYGAPYGYPNPNAPYGYPQQVQTVTRTPSYPAPARRSSSGV